jgi:hypothetical protein
MRNRIESIIAGAVGALFSAVLLGPLVRSVDASYVPVPSGTIAHFNSATCPAGWAEFTAGRGFYILNRVASGTLATGVGTALTNQENRPVGQHNHGLTMDPHTHPFTPQNSMAGAGAVSGSAASIKADQATTSGANLATGPSATTSATTSTGTIANSGSVAGTNAPYIQLLACSKS